MQGEKIRDEKKQDEKLQEEKEQKGKLLYSNGDLKKLIIPLIIEQTLAPSP